MQRLVPLSVPGMMLGIVATDIGKEPMCSQAALRPLRARPGTSQLTEEWFCSSGSLDHHPLGSPPLS